MNDNNRGQTIFLSVIGIATLLVAIIGATFAYFTTTMTGDAQNVSGTTAKLGTTSFTADPMVITDKMLPGYKTVAKNITVTREASDNDADFKCQLILTGNDLTDLYVSSTSDDTNDTVVTDKQIATKTDANITVDLVTGTLKAGETVTRNLTYTIEFKETNTNQDLQQGKSFAGTVACSLNNTTVYYNAANPTGTTTEPTATEPIEP